MVIERQVPDSNPLMIAWKEYSTSPEYVNAERWLADPEHRKGSMWAAFSAGYRAAPPTELNDMTADVAIMRLEECLKSFRTAFVRLKMDGCEDSISEEIWAEFEDCDKVSGEALAARIFACEADALAGFRAILEKDNA